MRWSAAVHPLQKHSLQHSTQTIFARSVLAQESAETPLFCGVRMRNGPSRPSPAGASIACPSRPLGTKYERKGRNLGGNARTAGLRRPTASPLARFRFRAKQRGLPPVTDAASPRSAQRQRHLRTSRAAQRSRSVPKQPAPPIIPPSRYLFDAPCHSTNIYNNVSSPLSLKTLSPISHAQRGRNQGRSSRRVVSTIAGAFLPVCSEKNRAEIQKQESTVKQIASLM